MIVNWHITKEYKSHADRNMYTAFVELVAGGVGFATPIQASWGDTDYFKLVIFKKEKPREEPLTAPFST